MLKTRLIPVLFLKNGLIVRSEHFRDFRELGNPINQLERLRDWSADELIYIDITRDGDYDLKRDDMKVKRQTSIIEILQGIARVSFMPLTFGGRINTLEDVDAFIANGADKVVVNSGAYRNPGLIKAIAQKYGSQAIVVGIDVKNIDGHPALYIDNGRTMVDDDAISYAQRVEALGAGEIFLNSIDRDGTSLGYDAPFIKRIVANVKIPVIACGGAGDFNDFIDVVQTTGVSAVAAGNIFNFTENAYIRAKKKMKEAGIFVR